MTVVIFRMAAQATDLRSPLLLGAIAGGAVGNLIDRVVRAEDGILSGHVVDFIDFQWWPIFNIADAGIVVGVVSLILMQLFLPDDKEVVPSDG
jgi:signal peptidase II